MSTLTRQHPADAQGDAKAKASPRDYLAIARVDHWTKHVFILPGIVLAVLLTGQTDYSVLDVLLGFVSAAAISSANYTINEWLDRRFDIYHPTKSKRSSVVKDLSPKIVYTQYVLLSILGLGIASLLSPLFLFASVTFLLSGLVYNVEPVRSKDIVFADVLTESLNNPIRLLLGWAMIDPATLPPSSLMIAYWMGGAFLMASKRLSEYRQICAAEGTSRISLYRRSFAYYTERTLLLSCFIYALASAFMIAVFSLKYRAEYMIAFPMICLLFTYYLAVSLDPDSVAQRPERLFKQRPLMAIVGILVVLLCVLTVVDIPILERISEPHILVIPNA